MLSGMLGDLLPRGKKNAMDEKFACYLLGADHDDFEEAVVYAQRSGLPVMGFFDVATGCKRYYLAKTKKEVAQFLRCFWVSLPDDKRKSMLMELYGLTFEDLTRFEFTREMGEMRL